jgi:uncharacterized membrane protein
MEDFVPMVPFFFLLNLKFFLIFLRYMKWENLVLLWVLYMWFLIQIIWGLNFLKQETGYNLPLFRWHLEEIHVLADWERIG